MMTASKDFRQPAGHTSSAGWIVSLPYYRHRGNVYFSLQASMECLGLQSHLKKNGFKFIDKFVSENDSALYRRGTTVFFSSTPTSDLRKGMMLELTPRKQHARVATSSRERPRTIDVQHLKEPPPLPLHNQTFVISGNISERNDKEKFTTEKLTILIKQLGGEVFASDIEKAVEAQFIVISSQKEVNRPLNKMNKTLIMAYRLGWHIVSKSIIIETRDSDTMPSTSSHLLDVTNLRNAPSTSIVHAKVITRGNMVDNHHVIGAHRELKKKLREGSKRLRSNEHSTEKQKHPPKKQCTSYVMFSKTTWKSIVKEHPGYSMSQINCLISEMWKELDDEKRQAYKELAAEYFEQLIDKDETRSV